ncbi:heparin binding hemagglutinin HbhA [Actinopolyspora biskrensis]|uniref:Heparin binding hemagglutinin HbhA n=1 Tax=Actinopolyspora biskrensis TaxID=1470178 RepID=A0A852Z8D5_9ACTN|nr:hypothetical protein [Actinopolyspora biskrensis]NYH78727.1 heparin binding hemagglutinin HbhA [Actinopolyspora biskrensis]
MNTRHEDLRRVRLQAGKVAETAYQQARGPLVAALGAGDIAAHAVAETAQRVRDQISDCANAARESTAGTPSDLGELRDRLRSGELRKLLDHYRDSAVQVYGYCGERGERTLEQLRTRPEVQRTRDQVGQAQHRVEEVVDGAWEVADDVLGKVSTTTRSFGEKAARTTENVAEETAEKVNEAGDRAASAAAEASDSVREAGKQAASETRSTARRTAARSSAAKKGGSTGESGSGDREQSDS